MGRVTKKTKKKVAVRALPRVQIADKSVTYCDVPRCRAGYTKRKVYQLWITSQPHADAPDVDLCERHARRLLSDLRAALKVKR